MRAAQLGVRDRCPADRAQSRREFARLFDRRERVEIAVNDECRRRVGMNMAHR